LQETNYPVDYAYMYLLFINIFEHLISRWRKFLLWQ